MSTLLPPASTAFERAIEQTAAKRIDALNPPIKSLWNPDTCPESVLPFLAWAFSVDEWDEGWGIDKKRQVIKEARFVHQHKGTIGAIRRALASVGQSDAVITDRLDCFQHNGLALRDGTRRRMGPPGWPTYRVSLKSPATIAQAYQIKRLLAAVQRNCIELRAIDYQQAAVSRNSTILRNGAFTRGVVNTSI